MDTRLNISAMLQGLACSTDQHLEPEQDNGGFTVLELMIVVAMIGVLAMIAIPSYTKLVQKAWHAQAKMGLASVYELELVYRMEHNSYNSRLDAIGFQMEGNVYFNISFANDFAPPLPAVQGTPGCTGLCSGIYGYVTCLNVTYACFPSAQGEDDAAELSQVTTSTFTAEAHAHLPDGSGGVVPFTWLINQFKQLTIQPNPS